MKSKTKKVTLVIIGIIIIAIILVIGIKMLNKNKENTNIEENSPNSNNTIQNEEKYVTKLNDGTKVNISETLKQTKTYKELEISDITVTSTNGITVILANIKNVGSNEFTEEVVQISLIDENDEEIIATQVLIPTTEAGQTMQLEHTFTTDVANIKDFKIEEI